MTEKQIEYMCDLGRDNRFMKQMVNLAATEKGTEEFLIINKDGTFSGIPRAALYNKCIAMVDDRCFYIDGEKGLTSLVLPFDHRSMYDVTKEERAAAIAYAKDHGIEMPGNLRSLFQKGYSEPEIIKYMTPSKNMFQTEKERDYFARVLSDIITVHKKVFLHDEPVSEKTICDEIVYGYNKKILSNMAFSENIRKYPKDSPVCKLVTYAFYHCDIEKSSQRAYDIWAENNVTPSMDKADFGLFKVIASIKRPMFEKSPGNKTPGTFDIIRVWFSLISKDIMPERNEFIKKNKRGFARLAFARIKDDRRCEMPVNLLKIDHIGITSQSQLEFIFSLKDEVTTALNEKGDQS